MPESVFTQTMPLLLAGGVCCVWVGFGLDADLLVEPPEPTALDELVGALEGAGAGAGLELAAGAEGAGAEVAAG